MSKREWNMWKKLDRKQKVSLDRQMAKEGAQELKNIKAAGDKYIRDLKWSKANTAKWMNTKLPTAKAGWLNIKTRGAGVLSGAVDIARGTKQVLPTVSRQLLPYAKGLGWAGLITTGVSLLSNKGIGQYKGTWFQGAQTKRAKKYRADLQGTKPQNIKHFPAQRQKK